MNSAFCRVREPLSTASIVLLSLALIPCGVARPSPPRDAVGSFVPPDPSARRAAIGPTDDVPEALRRALDPAIHFEPLAVPGPLDWLANHEEEAQSFADFVAGGMNRPQEKRTKIYFQPIGVFAEDASPPLAVLEAFARAFFALEVVVRPTLPMDGKGFTTRTHPTSRRRQVLTTDVLRYVQERLPDDAFCVLAITMEDLFPEPSWNFVFGQASLRGRVGVYSFARYDPAFLGDERPPDYEPTLLARSLKVLAHETAHMFGLRHCVFFKCLLNGSNTLREADKRPLTLCPVCLRKLHHSTRFDVVARYRKLLAFYREHHFDEQAAWIERRLRRITR